jgi:hypothetical protein
MKPRHLLLAVVCLAGSVGAAAAAPPSSPTAIGGQPRLPVAKPGTLAVVVAGPFGTYGPGRILPIVVHNNTKRAASEVHAAASALDAKGHIVAGGQDEGFQPAHVPAGGLALGYVRFGGSVPAGARFSFQVTDAPAGVDVGFSQQIDMPITGARYARGHVTGSGTNPTRKKVYRSFDVLAACFSRAGKLVTFGKAFGSKPSAGPGAKVPFDVDFTRGGNAPAPACAHVLVSMIAHSQPF